MATKMGEMPRGARPWPVSRRRRSVAPARREAAEEVRGRKMNCVIISHS